MILRLTVVSPLFAANLFYATSLLFCFRNVFICYRHALHLIPSKNFLIKRSKGSAPTSSQNDIVIAEVDIQTDPVHEEDEVQTQLNETDSVDEEDEIQTHPNVEKSRPRPELNSGATATNRKNPKVETVGKWGYDWLGYEEKDGYVCKVWCNICRGKYLEPESQTPITKKALHVGQQILCDFDAFTLGTNNVKKDTAKCHGASKTHLLAQQVDIGETTLFKSLLAMEEWLMERMKKLFDIAYCVAYAELPFQFYETMVAVEKKHGVDLGVTYSKRAACRDFIGHIAGSMVDDFERSFKTEPFYCSLLFDGSTDKSISEKEVVSLKVIEDGMPKIKLLG